MSSDSRPPLPTSWFGQNSSINPFLGKGIASQGYDWTSFFPLRQTASSPSSTSSTSEQTITSSSGSTVPSGKPTTTPPAVSGSSSSGRNTILIISATTIVSIIGILFIFLLFRYRKWLGRNQQGLQSAATSPRVGQDPEQGRMEPFPIKTPQPASASSQSLGPLLPNQPRFPTSIRSLKQYYQRLNDNAIVSSPPFPAPSSRPQSPFHAARGRNSTQFNPSRSPASPNIIHDDLNATTLEQRVDALQRIMEQVSEEITLGRIVANAEPPPRFASLNPGYYPADASQNTDRSLPVEAPPDYSSSREGQAGQGGQEGHSEDNVVLLDRRQSN